MPPDPVVFLFDVDNTLLDNDRVTLNLRRYLEQPTKLTTKAQRHEENFKGLTSCLCALVVSLVALREGGRKPAQCVPVVYF
jgi:hypothetical protein